MTPEIIDNSQNDRLSEDELLVHMGHELAARIPEKEVIGSIDTPGAIVIWSISRLGMFLGAVFTDENHLKFGWLCAD